MERLKDKLRVPPEKLRCRCRPEEIKCSTTEELVPLKDFIGQERAVRAMQFGISMKVPGYNIYVAGPTGTGKSTYLNDVLKQAAAGGQAPDDWVYLYNFGKPDSPQAIALPAGIGPELVKDMEDLVKDLQAAIPKAFESEDYEQQKAAITQGMEKEIDRVLSEVKKEAADTGFALKQGPSGLFFSPVRDGKRLSMEEYEALPGEVQEEIERQGRQLQQKLDEAMVYTRQLDREAKQKISGLDRQIALVAAGPLVKRLKDRYGKYRGVERYLDNVLEELARNLDQIKPSPVGGPGSRSLYASEGLNIFNRFQVNLFVSNSGQVGAPVIFENSPNYYNIFGKIEYRSIMGTFSTDHTMIKSGAIHKANGGYLVLQAKDALADPLVWDALKRALKNKVMVVENIGEQYRMVPTVSLRPEEIPLDVKVILVGNHSIYGLLYGMDEDFRKFFKVKVDFDTDMPRNQENINHYAAFAGAVCKREGCKHFDCSGLAELVEYGSRLAGSQRKLSTRFNEVIEVVYEAAAWAEKDDSRYVGKFHVQKAIEEKIFRSGRIEEKIREMMLQDILMVDTDGWETGQINGLSVVDTGDYVFGRPSRITASTFMGHEGVVNIERESRMSGSSHTKGVLTLVGYLGGRFAKERPLRLSARISFEQLYDGVDGDSASSTELYCLLSSLSGLPVDQSLAVTGSVNQKGEIQPIGGVTEKIEGFFELCRQRGFTGRQGVVIPLKNIDNLNLRHDVIKAVEEGNFHIYAISMVEEGIELLTGIEAGQADTEGKYTPGTVFALVNEKLDSYARGLKEFAGGPGNTGGCGGLCQ